MPLAPTTRTAWPAGRAAAAAALCRAVLACGTLLVIAAPAWGQEDDGPSPLDGPERQFLQGLRDRNMADAALAELDRLAADGGLPAELKAALPYERALSLLSLARTAGPGVDARARLDEAAALLETFAEENPRSPLAGDARFLQAEILQQAAADLLAVDDPVALPEEVKTEARRKLERAGDVYVDAQRALKRAIEEIGLEQRDEAAAARRKAAQGRLIRARVEAARVTFRRAQTYAVGSADRDRLLDEADAPLEELKKDSRISLGVLPGRIIQGQIRLARVPDDPAAVEALPKGKKDEGVQQLTIAATTLKEVVDQTPPAGAGAAARDAVERLRGTAQRLRLSVLNHPLKADHATAVREATAWLDGDRARGGTESGAGVLFERGLAHERGAPAEDAAEDGAARDRTRALRTALADFETAARRSQAVRGPATLAADRVREKLGLDREEPQTFADAFDAAQALLRDLKEKQTAVQAAETPADREAARGDLDALLSEAARLLTAATELSDGSTDPGELSRARYLLAFTNVQLGRYYEAAILAEYVAKNFTPPAPDPDAKEKGPDQSGIPLDAASTAALAWTKAFQDRPEGSDGAFELAQLGEVADWIADKYPGSDRASAARVTLGRVLLGDGQLADAAAVFDSVPESDPNYADARLKAGDALWRRSLEVSRMDAPPPGPTADDLRGQAKQRLRTGVNKAEAALPKDGTPSDQLIIGKLTLAQISNRDGEFAGAEKLLTGGKAKVTAAVSPASPGDGGRPEKGVTSARFAGLVYQTLLRAQIGLKKIDAARDTIKQIQSVSDGGNVELFRSLGEQIREELAAMPPGPERTEARQNLAGFLDQIRSSGDQTLGSLMWVAETYGGLAEDLPDGSPEASGYLTKAAAALRDVLAKHLPDGDAGADTADGVRLRLGELLAAAGKYEQGYGEVLKVVGRKPNALNVQIVAADLLAARGEAEADGAVLAKALTGDEADGVWGWGKISQRVAAQLIQPGGERFQADYNAARLRIPEVRALLAETKSGDEKTAEYRKAEKELLSWVTLTDPAAIPEETRRDAEDLYIALQEGRGEAVPRPLPTDPAGLAAADAAGGAPDAADAGAPADPAAEPPIPNGDEEDDGPNVVLLAVGIGVLALITVGAIVAFRPKPRKRAARRTSGAAAAAGGAKKKDRGSVRSSLPDVAPVPVAAPAAAAAEPAGTGFPDFSALPQKKASKPAAGTAPRTRSGSPSSGGSSSGSSGSPAGKTRRPSSAAKPASAAAAKPASGGAAAGKTRRPSSSGSSSGSSSSSSAEGGDGRTRRRSSSGSGSSGSSSGSKPSGSKPSGDAPPRKRRPKPPSE